MGQWTIEVDEENNRVYAELSGFFETDEAAEAADAYIEAATELDGSFDMINDLSEFQIGDGGALEELERGKERMAEEGLTTVVRIPPTALTGSEQYEETGQDAESYDVETADSVEAAEEILDG